jgi:hypothetical protein
MLAKSGALAGAIEAPSGPEAASSPQPAVKSATKTIRKRLNARTLFICRLSTHQT